MSLSTLRMRLPADADLSVKIKEIVVPRKLSFLTDLVVCSSSLLVVGSFLWFPLALYFVLKRCKTRRARLIVLAVVVVLVLVPVKQWPAVRRTRFWDAWTRYFSPTIIVDGDKELPSDRSLLYCFMPHGIYPFGQGISLVSKLNEFFRDACPVTAPAVLKFPLFRHLMGWVGAVPSSKEGMEEALRNKTNLLLVPGGIGEMFRADSKNEATLLQGRRGFVKMAIQHGVPIVPVYIFGNSKTLRLAPFSRALEWISRKIRVSLLAFWGRYFLPIPFRRPLLYVVGQPIEFERNPAPTAEEVKEVHSRFVKAVAFLFDKYKGVYGWGGKSLSIL